MELDQIFTKTLDYFTTESWIAQVFIIVFATLLVNWVQKRLLKKLYAKLGRTNNYWDDSLIEAAESPLSALIWILGLSFAAEIAQAQSDSLIFSAIDPIREVGVIASLAWFLVRFIRLGEKNIVKQRLAAGEEFDQTTADAIAKLLRISVVITAGLVILQTLGYSVSGVLAFGGIGGIAVGYAAKDLLANFFGGLTVYMDRPFDVGDWIRSPDREIEGSVEKIGWRVTCIRTFDKRPLYVPNSVFTTIAVENPSRMTNRRIYETVGIRYDDAAKMDQIVKEVKNMLQEHEEIDTGQTLIVNFNDFAPSSLDFFVYTFTRTTNWIKFHEIKQDVMLKIINIIESNGAECAFPTSTIHLANQSPPVEAD